MESALLKDAKNKRKKKFRKKYFDHPKLLVNKTPDKGIKPLCNPKKKEKMYFSSEKKKKKLRNISTFISSTGHATDEVVSNTSIKGSDNASEKDVSFSSKAERRMKKLKKKITNKNKVCMEKKGDVFRISKNINGKRKRVHSDAEFSLTKKDKNITCKKSRLSSSEILKEFTTVGTSKNRNHSKNSVFLYNAQTEDSKESDSDEDREIRNELKSSSIYNNIQKLIKDNPSMLSTVNVCEEEFFEAESPRSLSDSYLEEESTECLDDINSDSADEKSRILQKDLFIPTSNSDKKVIAEKGCNRAQTGLKVNKKQKMAVTTSTASACDFNRTQTKNLPNREEKVISKKGSSSLRDKALEKLQGAKFRYLNEKLYTESGKDSFNYFQENRDDYMDYHKGYSLQVAKWPLNPVDKIISSLQKMKKNIIIADMGCGDAKIARTLPNCTVYSFDLVALNEFVTPCNISKVPLSNESVDIVVFCLSLMGTNLKEYLQEAYRIAKFGSVLKIAEVESRIPNLDQFIKSIEALGFSLEKKDVEHKLFVFLEFKKMKKKKKCATKQDITLKPCLYKKR